MALLLLLKKVVELVIKVSVAVAAATEAETTAAVAITTAKVIVLVAAIRLFVRICFTCDFNEIIVFNALRVQGPFHIRWKLDQLIIG